MPPPVALQLYTLRELAAQDFEHVVNLTAEIGYVGVEPAGFPGTSAKEAGQLFSSLTLEVPSAHLPLPIGDKTSYVIDTAGLLGTKHVVSGLGIEDHSSVDNIKRTAEHFNEASAAIAPHGLTFGIHNHWWEYLTVAGRIATDILLEHLSPEVVFEVDVYWVQVGGCDPAEVLKRLGNRAPLIHLKDGPCSKDTDMTALGEGLVDLPKVISAGENSTQWHIVELDSCATDMVTAVEKSYEYLIRSELSIGNKKVDKS